jgi:hypothetical protein
MIKHGDYVETSRHGYRGRVYNIKRLEPCDADWIRAQSIPVTLEQALGLWNSILVHDGGSVLSPIDTSSKIKPIKGFKHPCAKEYFK